MNPNDPHASHDGPQPPGWLRPDIQTKIAWRDGDIVISVPIKSGTTWTMNIVHQLREGGDADFEDIYAEARWIEFRDHPEHSIEDIVKDIDGMRSDRRRIFKSHSGPNPLPFHKAGSGKDVKYVVVMRNPEEAMVSALPFFDKHSQGWFDLWGVPKEAIVKPDFATFFGELGPHMLVPMIFGFVASWWPLRNEPNVLFMHFSDMKKDHEGSVRKIADHLGFTTTAEQWPNILEYTSSPWMKAHEDKFEARTMAEPRILDPGAMVRKGKSGAQKEDGMTDEISAQIREAGRQILQDGNAFEWLYAGGPLPG
jgi:hypothetical protein